MSKGANLAVWLIAILVVGVLGFLLGSRNSGVRFADASNVNLPVSGDVMDRVRGNGLHSLSPEEIVGAVIYDMKSDEGRYYIWNFMLPQDYQEPELEILGDEKYEAFVNDAAILSMDILGLGKFELEASDIMSLSIKDAGRSGIPPNKVDWDRIDKLAQQPYPDGVNRVLYVYKAIQSVIAKKVYHKIAADATGVAGNTFGASGSVYNSVEGYSLENVLGLVTVPVHHFMRQGEVTITSAKSSGLTPIEFVKQRLPEAPQLGPKIDTVVVKDKVRPFKIKRF